jgi:hypothetical protein
MLVLICSFYTSCLDFKDHGANYTEEAEGNGDVYYKEPNLLGGGEGMAYDIAYRAVENELRPRNA